MCRYCNEDEPLFCPDCGVWICYDVENGDDVIQPASATPSGDLACRRCAIRAEREEERAIDEECWPYFDPYELFLVDGDA